MKQPDLSGRLARWVFKLQGYKFTVKHRKGKDHIVPDALSRIPIEEVGTLEMSEPEIDLNSPCFEDDDYAVIKEKVNLDPSKYPDVQFENK